jgi:hypothetical protein
MILLAGAYSWTPTVIEMLIGSSQLPFLSYNYRSSSQDHTPLLSPQEVRMII